MDIDELARRLFDAVVANVRSAYLRTRLTVRLSLCCLCRRPPAGEDHRGWARHPGKALARSLGWLRADSDDGDPGLADVTAPSSSTDTACSPSGPARVFTNVWLADGTQPASPKSQSACSEAMEERHGVRDGTSHLAAPACHGHRHPDPFRPRPGPFPPPASPARPVPAPVSTSATPTETGGPSALPRPSPGEPGGAAPVGSLEFWRPSPAASTRPTWPRRCGLPCSTSWAPPRNHRT